jgi:hypothetical protein
MKISHHRACAPALPRLLLAITLMGGLQVDAAAREGHPRLLGASIGAKNYHEPGYQEQLARMDVVILGFYPGWRGDRDGSVIRKAVQALKKRNPSLLIGQYTILNEAVADRGKSASQDKIDKLDEMNWWLRDAATGAKVQWTKAYAAYDVNFTSWSRPDLQGDRYPQWLARRDYERFFKPVPEIDLWYFDNVMKHSRVPSADWRQVGTNVSSADPEVAKKFREGQAAHWAAAAALAPKLIQMGNPDNDLSFPEYKGRLTAAFLEGLMGKSWSLETRLGWPAMMERYRAVRENLKEPAIIGFNVAGRPDDYRFMRYALGSCLLGDGYFSFTDEKAGYGPIVWFDEYDVRIGKAVEPSPVQPWSEGVYRRRYENAMVLVNPEASARRVKIEPGWKRFKGTQAPDVNDGSEASTIVLPPRDGLILVRKES